ncbi:hypothetical protein GTA08_BOTSDO08693 [Neofusicoccum parvum]|uniref:Uncharacterized protein n=1 Tax=Neofusicoccum parvum TaxID=310453 RepID=A0ACB5SG24_9PEZI|nr:hypothetical protein GTA08_BOTSDO08693 [Neofusicoccum parvum]
MAWDGESAQRLLNGTSGMFNSRLYSDLEVLCKDGATYYVHKYIVCPQSDFFRNACNPDHGFKEAQENVIDLSNDDPALVKAVLRFFYYHDYEPTTNTEPMLLFHTKMYVMGAYYFIPGLKEHAKKKFRSLILDGSWETKEFPDAIAEIYDWTVESDKGLRDVVVRATTDNFDTLKTDQHFLDVAWSIPEFSVEVMTHTLSPPGAPSPPKTYKCGKCLKAVDLCLPRNAPYRQFYFCTKCGFGFLTREWKQMEVVG